MSTLIHGFLESVKKRPFYPALWVQNKYYSYQELYQQAERIALMLQAFPAWQCLIFAGRTLTAYAGVLGSLLAGKTYVPLRPKMPLAKNLTVLVSTQTNLVIIDRHSLPEALPFLNDCQKNLVVILPDCDAIPSEFVTLTQHQFILATTQYRSVLSPLKNNYAYLLFTSGSTGVPKGVMVKHNNILPYLKSFIERAKPNCHDRFIHLADLTFDFSVHDCFVPWSVGACVYSFPEEGFLGLAAFVKNHEITFWGSVPSMAVLLNHCGKLVNNCFPDIRYSMFCGEALSENLVQIWQNAAPNSVIDNFYGPTEASVCFMAHRWSKYTKVAIDPIVPIGKPFPNLSAIVVNEKLEVQPSGVIGELCLSGPQVVDGYWDNPKLTKERFFYLDQQKWYRTGDLVSFDKTIGYHYKGRVDDQVQIRGCRVEKLEIECTLKNITNTESVAVLAWPRASDGTVLGVVAFISGAKQSVADILKKCRTKMPDYMVPREIYLKDSLPLTPNGKINYSKLVEELAYA